MRNPRNLWCLIFKCSPLIRHSEPFIVCIRCLKPWEYEGEAS